MRSVLTHEPARAEAAVVEVLTGNEESIYWFAMLHVKGGRAILTICSASSLERGSQRLRCHGSTCLS